MSEGKQYYWLKLQHDFFSSKRIKKLRRLDQHGDTYVLIYLKMQLHALQSDGIIEYTGLEPTFAEELALDLEENVDAVAKTIEYLLDKNLMQTADNEEYLLPYVLENTGSDSAAVQRGKRFRDNMTEEQQEAERERNRIKAQRYRAEKKEQEKSTERVPNEYRTSTERVPNEYRTSTERVPNVEIEKEIEIELEKDIKTYRAKKDVCPRFSPPTLDEVKDYCWERGNQVDPEAFINFYQSKGWLVGKNKMKDWKAAVRTWEQKDRQGKKQAPGSTYTSAVQNRMNVVQEWATKHGGIQEGGGAFD